MAHLEPVQFDWDDLLTELRGPDLRSLIDRTRYVRVRVCGHK